MGSTQIPDFDSLPKVQGPNGVEMPQGCAWGIFDKGDKKDVYGTLNLLTPDIIKEAYKEARDGVSISLNWSLGGLKAPIMRKALVHKPINLLYHMGMHGWDDELEFNTQSSSQWDSLLHYYHQPTATAYNGVQTSVEELTQPFGKEDVEQRIPTLNHWHARGGLVARAVFLDYKRWAEAHDKTYDPLTAEVFSVADLEACATDQRVEFKYGDVLIVRSGFTEIMSELEGDKQMTNLRGVCGVEGTVAAAKWIWNKHFSAVAGDMIAFEQIQPVMDKVPELVLHPYLLSLFGMSIGELWSLKALSEHCAKTGRYSFLLTSVPLNVPGLAGSPPNALALF